jgi:hypothetical protein
LPEIRVRHAAHPVVGPNPLPEIPLPSE